MTISHKIHINSAIKLLCISKFDFPDAHLYLNIDLFQIFKKILLFILFSQTFILLLKILKTSKEPLKFLNNFRDPFPKMYIVVEKQLKYVITATKRT